MTTTPTSIRDRAFAAIPGYHEAHEILAAAKRHRAVDDLPPTFDEAQTELVEGIRHSLAAGEPVPVDVAMPLVDVERTRRALKLRDEAFVNVIESAKHDLANPSTHSIDAAFAVLSGELEQLVSDATEMIGQLEGRHTPAAAISDSQTVRQAWEQLTTAADTYDEIRAAQLELLRLKIENGTNFWPTVATAWYADAIDIATFWVSRRRDAAANTLSYSPTPDKHVIWLATARTITPIDSAQSWWPHDDDRTAAFISILERSRPWVPELDTLREAYRAGLAATTPVRPLPKYINRDPAESQKFALEQYRALAKGQAEPTAPAADMAKHEAMQTKLNEKIATAASLAQGQARARHDREMMSHRS